MYKHLLSLFVAVMMFAGASTTAKAEMLSVGMGIPVGYSAPDAQSTSGTLLRLSVPILPTIGYDQLEINMGKNSQGGDMTASLKMVDLIFGIPFVPVVDLKVGAGFGAATVTGTLDPLLNTSTDNLYVAPASQIFASVGYSFGPLGVHLSMHNVACKVQETGVIPLGLPEYNIGGSLTALTLTLGF